MRRLVVIFITLAASVSAHAQVADSLREQAKIRDLRNVKTGTLL